MKSLGLSLIVLSMFISTAHAEYDVVTITDSNAVSPDNPVIDGDWILWQDDVESDIDTGLDVFGRTVADPNVRAICVFSDDQEVPAVSGRYAVWQDDRNTKREIRALDLDLLSEPVFPNLTTNNSFHKRYPDISDNIIVWQDYRNGDTDIYMYNIATDTEQQVYQDDGESWGQFYPAIDGSLVVWQDTRHGNYQIYKCSIDGQPERVLATEGNQWYPDISGDLIVWEEQNSSNYDITVVAYNNVTETIWTHTIPSETTAFNALPAVSDGVVVWQEYNGTDYDIRGYDTVTGQFMEIAVGIEDDRKPAISGSRVVWQRNGTAIVGTELATSSSSLWVISPAAGQMIPAGMPVEIAWQLVPGTGDAPQTVDISCRVGESQVIPIAEDVPFTQGTVVWESTAGLNSQQCHIQVTDPAGSGLSGMFTIYQCSSLLTADLTGDCFVDMADMAELAHQWLACGNPYDAGCLTNE